MDIFTQSHANTKQFHLNFSVFWVLLFCILFGFTLSASAQAHHMTVPSHATTQKIARIQTHIMAGRMTLKSNQESKVNELNQRYLEKLTELLKNTTITKEEKLKELQKIRESKQSEMKGLLTEDQYKEYLKIRDDLKEQRRQRIKDAAANTSEETPEE